MIAFFQHIRVAQTSLLFRNDKNESKACASRILSHHLKVQLNAERINYNRYRHRNACPRTHFWALCWLVSIRQRTSKQASERASERKVCERRVS